MTATFREMRHVCSAPHPDPFKKSQSMEQRPDPWRSSALSCVHAVPSQSSDVVQPRRQPGHSGRQRRPLCVGSSAETKRQIHPSGQPEESVRSQSSSQMRKPSRTAGPQLRQPRARQSASSEQNGTHAPMELGVDRRQPCPTSQSVEAVHSEPLRPDGSKLRHTVRSSTPSMKSS